MTTVRRAALVCITSALCAVVAKATPTLAERSETPKLPMTVRFVPPDICEIVISGQTFSLPDDEDRMIVALKKLRRTWRAVSVSGGIETPYRCIGFAIYLSQRGGFSNVGFTAEPPALND